MPHTLVGILDPERGFPSRGISEQPAARRCSLVRTRERCHRRRGSDAAHPSRRDSPEVLHLMKSPDPKIQREKKRDVSGYKWYFEGLECCSGSETPAGVVFLLLSDGTCVRCLKDVFGPLYLWCFVTYSSCARRQTPVSEQWVVS